MAGAVAMQDFMGQYGIGAPYLRSDAITAPSAPSPAAVMSTCLPPGSSADPWSSAIGVLAWKGLTCDGWSALDPASKDGVITQYYNRYGLTPDVVSIRRLYAAIDLYCEATQGSTPAGQASSPDTSSTDANASLYGDPNSSSTSLGKLPTGGTDYGNPNVSSSLPGKDTAGGNTSTISPSLYTAVGNALGQGANTIASIVNSNNQVEIARLQTQAQTAIARLGAQNAQTNDAQTQANNQAQIDALQRMIPYTQPPPPRGLSTGAILAIGAAGLVVVGGIAYVVTRGPRKNPGNVRDNPVVRQGPKHRKKFINAAHLRRMRHHR